MGLLICPDCNKSMEVDSKKIDGSKYECTCRGCVKFWKLERFEPTQDELRELVQTG